jgi:hypothetical protein
MFVIVQHNQLYGIEKDTTACTPTNRLDHPTRTRPRPPTGPERRWGRSHPPPVEEIADKCDKEPGKRLRNENFCHVPRDPV